MSYILDALRKTQGQRRSDQAPEIGDILRVDGQPRPAKARSGRWLLWLGVGLGICLGIAGGYALQHWQLSARSTPLPEASTGEEGNVAESAIQRYAEQVRQTKSAVQEGAAPASAQSASPPKDDEPVLAYPSEDTMPEFSLEVISFSERRATRFAMINGAIVKEGDELASGYQLVEILADHVLLIKDDETLTLGLDN